MTALAAVDTVPLHPLTRYRQRHNLSMNKLAARAGTTLATVSRIESGSRQPTVDMLFRLVEATGREVSADEIIYFHMNRQGIANRRN